jgi:hypothetical protein
MNLLSQTDVCPMPPQMRVNLAGIADFRKCRFQNAPTRSKASGRGTSDQGGEPYFGLAMEWRLRRAFRSFPRPAFRPIEASKVAICNGRFTSTPVVRH